MLTSLS